MKITSIKTICLSRLHERERQWITARYRTIKADCAIVVIDTDEGVQGIGEACAYGVPTLIREWVSWLSPSLVGQNPIHPTLAPHPNGRSRPHDCAVAGIDSALWDLRGKLSGKRVSELLGEGPLDEGPLTERGPDQVRLYASSGCRYDWRSHPQQLIEETLAYVAEGYTACKVRIGTEWAWDGVQVDRFLGLMRELAQAVDGRMELMLDGNQRLTEAQALEIALELARLGFVWFEEPIPQEDIEGYVRLNTRAEIPISGGEQFTTLEQFRPYLERRAYDIVQPDAGICGISEALKIGRMAHRYGIDLCPHNWHNGLMTLANAHLVAALPNPRVLELCMLQGPLQWAILGERPLIQVGMMTLPDRPGLGVDLAEGLEAQFPYIEGHYAVVVER
ncbi:MAG: mandelate racemase/muconate lactonizing enzyme family protein [Chloroflexi bacterium]|nr:mandelate racemase/muconate lactonizing enzyme family protein [Chloroflexota bacterium]